ncbi:MAG TPA: antitoxin AF2212-like protein [Phycisphaerales bacterium]|nr:antitoxin AF2212-like protein [Phycisphaerales bacterium]
MEFSGEISFTYTNGVLRPDEKLNLPEGARVRATVHVEEGHKRTKAEIMAEIRRLGDSGAFKYPGRTITRDEMHERH